MSGVYGLAVDLGTTTLAVSLIDTGNGRRLAMTGGMNPQRRFGADVVTRLDAAVRSQAQLTEMSRLVRDELWDLAGQVSGTTGIPLSEVRQIAIAGNPAMQHILLELPVTSLAFPPYRPRYTAGTGTSAAALGWESDAGVYLFPMPGGFVGGDTVAFLYGRGGELLSGNTILYLDMGTNGEMVLQTGDGLWATAAAAGPAFEGGNLACGMAALPGAVSSVRFVDDRVQLRVIGGVSPTGLCGSAAFEAVAELLRCDIVEPGGRLRDSAEIPSNLAARVICHGGENVFVLYRDARTMVFLGQGDIRQIQLAKSAIRAGMEVLAHAARTGLEHLDAVVLTGSFGAVLQPGWLKSIGIFDEGMIHMSRFTPEGVLAGAEAALAAGDRFVSAEALAARIRVIPLSGTPLFEELFLRHIDFPRCLP